jgi:hypothetical protein
MAKVQTGFLMFATFVTAGAVYKVRNTHHYFMHRHQTSMAPVPPGMCLFNKKSDGDV